MKNIKKCGLLALMSIAVLGFFGCALDDSEEDEKLILDISSNNNMVMINAPAEYDNQTIVILYTDDGTAPSVTYDKSKVTGTDYTTGLTTTGTVFTDPFEISADKTIKAIAYYFDASTQKLWKGKVASTKITYNSNTSVTTAATTSTATGASSGDFTFNLASTGNSNTTHYFDTSATNVFRLNDEHQNAYYQTQFSWKGTGKGKWYLYMRDLGGGIIKPENSDSNFLATGSYTGDCFNDSHGKIADGDLTLSNTDGTTGKVTISDKTKFKLAVNNTAASSSSLGTFTVADAK
ncbi:MAG: hypothetical protein IJ158_00915 [Treponema sp.]|nr:hypothetical protein [Treponema sp.]